jgi:restriction system protein
MPIPEYQTLMLPMLKVAGDGKVHTKREAVNVLAEQFKLTEERMRLSNHTVEGYAAG